MTEWARWRAGLRHRLRLKAPRTIRHDFRRHSCGPTSFASVELAFEPSQSFGFKRQCEWPKHLASADTREWDAAMEAGVHDALQPFGGSPYDAMGVTAKCILVEQDDVGSSQVAFYMAAWHATRRLREEAEWELVEREAAEQ
jgi:hypothetical protein